MPPSEPELQTEWIVFRASPIHGTGGFARIDIPVGARLLEYVGEKIDKAESLRRCEADNPFIFALNDHQDLDGNVSWNPARPKTTTAASGLSPGAILPPEKRSRSTTVLI
jgi:hypothetical protein